MHYAKIVKRKKINKTKTAKAKNIYGFFLLRGVIIYPLTLFVITLLAITLILPNKNPNLINKSCANSISCVKDLTGNYDENNTGMFMGKTISGPALADKPTSSDLSYNITVNSVLGETTVDSKHIYVDLTNQRLYAYENNNLIYDFPVSTGKWSPTPTGDFRIWIKLRYTRMTGGSQALGTYYNLPNVPYTMFFYNNEHPKSQGYGLHGAYWHNNFGHPMSHGCVNMREADVAQVYYWANPPSSSNITYASAQSLGTSITIYGITPSE